MRVGRPDARFCGYAAGRGVSLANLALLRLPGWSCQVGAVGFAAVACFLVVGFFLLVRSFASRNR